MLHGLVETMLEIKSGKISAREQESDLGLWKWLKFKIFGYVYLCDATKTGWSGYLPFYLVQCKNHGSFVDYSHGYSEYFTCPKCSEEAKKRWEEKKANKGQ